MRAIERVSTTKVPVAKVAVNNTCREVAEAPAMQLAEHELEERDLLVEPLAVAASALHGIAYLMATVPGKRRARLGLQTFRQCWSPTITAQRGGRAGVRDLLRRSRIRIGESDYPLLTIRAHRASGGRCKCHIA